MNLLTAVRHLNTGNAITCDEMRQDGDYFEVLVLEHFPRREIKAGRMTASIEMKLEMIKEAAEGWMPTPEQIESRSWTVIRYF